MVGSEFIKSLEWRAFEMLCYHILSMQDEYNIEINGGGSDKGADIIAKDKQTNQIIEIMQCKAYAKRNKVTVGKMRDFMGSMQVFGVKKGSYVTTSSYTANALELAKQFNIITYTIEDILQAFHSLPEFKQNHIEREIRKTDFTTPTCPSCGVKMVERIAKKWRGKGEPFWGCPSFPKCRNTFQFKKSDRIKKKPNPLSSMKSSFDHVDFTDVRPLDEIIPKEKLSDHHLFKPILSGLISTAVFIFISVVVYNNYESFFTKAITPPRANTTPVQETSFTTPPVETPPTQEAPNQPNVLPGISKLSCWQNFNNETFCTANSYAVPSSGYKKLVYLKLDNKKTYCWEDKRGKKQYASGLPVNTGDSVYKFLSVQ